MNTIDDTFRVLKRKITSRKEMNQLSHQLFPVGASMLDMEKWLIDEGWSMDEWKQSERDRKAGLL